MTVKVKIESDGTHPVIVHVMQKEPGSTPFESHQLIESHALDTAGSSCELYLYAGRYLVVQES